MSDSPVNNQDSVTTVPEANAAPPAAASRPSWLWPLALFVGAALAVISINYAPRPYVIPERLANLDMNSPEELHEEAAEVSLQLHWQNSLIAYGLAGACLGLSSLFMVRWQNIGRAVLAVVGCVVAGVACGLLAVIVAFAVSAQFSTGGAFARPAGSEDSLVPDLIVWILMSILLALPASLALWVAGERLASQKVMSVPLAGLLAGLLMPIAISLLLPAEKTSDVPPEGLLVTGAWMAVLAILMFLLTTFTGSKRPKLTEESVSAEKPA